MRPRSHNNNNDVPRYTKNQKQFESAGYRMPPGCWVGLLDQHNERFGCQQQQNMESCWSKHEESSKQAVQSTQWKAQTCAVCQFHWTERFYNNGCKQQISKMTKVYVWVHPADRCFFCPPLPHSLRMVIIPLLDKDGMLNYLKYLKHSFILEESIMFPFLAILKDHLEEFQVFLGNVESWLMESTWNAFFLQNTFHLSLEGYKPILRPYYLQIFQYSMVDEFQYKLMFDISNDNGQKKLTTFLAFLTQVG